MAKRNTCDRCGIETRNRIRRNETERFCNDCRDKEYGDRIKDERVQLEVTVDDQASQKIYDAQALLMALDATQFPPDATMSWPFADQPDPRLTLDLPPAPLPARGHEIHRELIGVIEDAIVNAPRTQQVMIGPSELGDPCLRCLAKKLVGLPRTRGDAWLPAIGSAVHTWLEEVLGECDCGWLPERKVTVGIVGNRIVRGTADLFGKRTVVDYKTSGKNTLDTTNREGPSQTYRVQAHLYGRGYELQGEDVQDVAILYLPRNSPTLADSIYWTEPYNLAIAQAALERGDYIYHMIKDDHSKILDLPRAQGCYNCFRYAPLPGEDNGMSVLPKQGNPFEGIIA